MPVVERSADEIAGLLWDRLDVERERVGAPSLARAERLEARLEAVARAGARRAAAGETDGLAQDLADEVELAGRLSVSVQVVFQLEDVELPPASLKRGVRAIGVAGVQDSAHAQGRIGVAILTLR